MIIIIIQFFNLTFEIQKNNLKKVFKKFKFFDYLQV